MKRVTPLLVLTALSVFAAKAEAQDNGWNESKIKNVLLISIDGMHAFDYLNCSQGIAGANGGKPYCPNMAELGLTGVNYVAASTSKPSDSFPGLMAIITGGSPALTGVYYDVAYPRDYNPTAK